MISNGDKLNRVIRADTFYSAANELVRLLSYSINTERLNCVLVPANFSIIAERLILSSLPRPSVTNIEISSIERFVKKANSNKKFKSISKVSSLVIISRLLHSEREKFSYIRVYDNPSKLAKDIYRAINIFRGHAIDTNAVKKKIVDIKEDNLKLKLNDLIYIYEKYVDNLNNNYQDKNTLIENCILAIESGDFDVSNINFYVTDFLQFDRISFKFIEAIYKHAASFNIFTVKGDTEASDKYYIKSPMYALGKLIDSSDIQCDITDVQSKLAKDQRHILNNLYNYRNYKKIKPEELEINLLQANNVKEEVKSVAKKIKALVSDGKTKYSDIIVAYSSGDRYSQFVRNIFKEYNIKFFMDDDRILSNESQFRVLLDALNIVNKNERAQEVLSFLYSRYINISYADKNAFEVYIKKHSMNHKILTDFFENKDSIYYEQALKVQKELINYIKPLKEMPRQLNGKIEKTQKFLENLSYETINRELALDNKIEGDSANMSVYMQVKDEIDNILSELQNILAERVVSMDEYITMLQIAAESINIADIPMYLDNVYVGDIDTSQFSNAKHIFILGLDGESLQVKEDDVSIISDKDIVNLKKADILSDNFIRDRQSEIKFIILQMLIKADVSLNLSFAKYYQGEEKRPSNIIIRLMSIFEGLELTTTQDHNNKSLLFETKKELNNFILSNYESSKNDSDYINFAANGDINIKLIEKKIDEYILGPLDENKGEEMQVSVSEIENFAQCPLKNLFERRWKIEILEDNILNDIATGQFKHKLMQLAFENSDVKKCFKTILSNNAYEQSDVEVLNRAINISFNEMLKNDDSVALIIKRHENLLLLHAIVEKLKSYSENTLSFVLKSKMIPTYFEMDVANKYEYKITDDVAIIIRQVLRENEIDDSFSEESLQIFKKDCAKKFVFKIKGRIDRVDVSDNNYMIVDYKSTAKTGIKDELEKTKTLYQLPIYADCLSNEDDFKDKKIAALMYFTLKDRYLTSSSLDEHVCCYIDCAANEFMRKFDPKKDYQNIHEFEEALNNGKARFCEYAHQLFNLGNAIPINIISNDNNACQYCKYSNLCGANKSED